MKLQVVESLYGCVDTALGGDQATVLAVCAATFTPVEASSTDRSKQVKFDVYNVPYAHLISRNQLFL